MNAVVDAIARLLGLPRFVARSALAAALFHVVFVGGVTVIKSGTNALFLSRADPAHLPLLYAAVAVVVALATTLLARLLTRRPLTKLVVEAVVVAAVLIILGCVVVEAGVPGATGLLYVVGEATATAGSVLFWSRVMDGFSPRDQKRVVGLVGGGGMLGAAVGGIAMRVVVDATGVVLPMIAAAVAWVAALPLLRLIYRRTRDDKPAPQSTTAASASTTTGPASPATKPSMRRAMGYLASAGYPRAVAGLVVLLAASGAATDFVFRAAAARAASENGMAGLFGMLNAVVGVVVVVLQVGLTARLLERLGVFLFAALVPTVLAVLSVVCMAIPGDAVTGTAGEAGFWLLIALKGVEMAGAYSLHPTVVALLYNPMPVELRTQSRTLIDGAIKKAGAAAAGLLLGALAAATGLVNVWTVLVLALATLGLLPLLSRLYVDALGQRLGGPATRARGYAIDPSDKDTRRALERGLRSDQPEDVLAALDVLGLHWTPPRDTLLALLEHLDERVRAAALARVPVHPDGALAAQLLTIARTPGARRPRAEAVRALARVQPGRAADAVFAFIDDDEPGVACAALEVCLRSRQDARARARLQGLLDNHLTLSSAWRRELARLLGALHEPRYTQALARLLEDDEDSVRTLAIDAAALAGDPALVEALVRHIGDVRTRAAVAHALVRFGDEAVPALSRALDDTSLGLSVRVHIPRLLQRIGSTAAAHALLFSNPRDNAYLQARIATALSAIAQARPTLIIDRQRTDEAIGRRLVAYAAYDGALRDLYALEEPRLDVLHRAVDDRRRQNLGIALDLLSLHRGHEQMQRVRSGLLSPDKQSWSDALELLDAALVADPLRTDFLSLLDAGAAAPMKPTRAIARVSRLCESKDPLLRGIARATVNRLARPADEADRTNPRGTVLPASFELLGDDMADELVERLFILEDVDLFAGLHADDLLTIASIATELTVPAGQFLYREGDVDSTNLYIIVDGIVELTRQGRPVLTLRPGETAGQVSFLDKGPRPVTARISPHAPARMLVIERDAFLDLMADRTSLMHAFFDVLARRLRALIEKTGG
ncbi:MAG: cyclic nucleotide-binding domain-containing protein [Deltaproteobacteria bacterium]|nr:cyclic nucleotide-binding domain-containing protein [Deltaproteobacteria bacterium]